MLDTRSMRSATRGSSCALVSIAWDTSKGEKAGEGGEGGGGGQGSSNRWAGSGGGDVCVCTWVLRGCLQAQTNMLVGF